MKYLLMIYGNEQANAQAMAADPNGWQTLMAAHNQFSQTFAKNIAGGEALHDTNMARSMRKQGDKIVVTNGPFAETAEQLGGFYLIEAASIDEAVEIAKHCPGLEMGGTHEVRPIVDFSA